MIRNNRRKPGTISLTPAANRRRQNVYIENYQQNDEIDEQTNPYIETAQILKVRTMNQSRDKEDTHKKRQQTYSFETLNMCSMNIENVQDCMNPKINLDSIGVMKLSENHICTFPSAIFNKLLNLTELYLDRNYLQKISFPYFKESKLKCIDISCNQLTSLNMEHLERMQWLNCSENNLTFLTLPKSLVSLNSSQNKLSNIYFMENCSLLKEVNLNGNLLYDLKFNFRVSDGRQRKGEIRFKSLQFLDCSNNKIQYFEGLVHIINIKALLLSNNSLSFTRNLINQLFTLQNLEELYIESNPLCDGGFREDEIISILCSKIPSLQLLNGESTQNYIDHQSEQSYCSSSKKSHFSDINEEPYQLFLPTQRKEKVEDKNVLKQVEWNFTLGDCEHEETKEAEINDLSLIEELKNVDVNHQFQAKSCQIMVQQKIESQHQPIKEIVQSQKKEIKLKVIRSNCPLTVPHHIHYQPFLKTLLPMSYVPPRPLFRDSNKVSSNRLEEDDDEYLLISNMFSSRGGVAYIKKVMAWKLRENEEQIFGRHSTPTNQPYMGFLLNQVNEKEFKQLTKFNRLVPRKNKDIIGLQPNVFSCFHIIVRFNSYDEDENYPCAYLIESSQI